MTPFFIIFIISTLGITSSSNCDLECAWLTPGEWSECSRTCGGGYQSRSLSLCCHHGESFDSCLQRCHSGSYASGPVRTKACNKICFNGGTFDGSCRCREGRTGTCCQEASTSYKFACIISTSKTNQHVRSQVTHRPEYNALSRVYVVKALFTVENYMPQNTNIVLRLCSQYVYSTDGCMMDHMSTSRDLIRNGTVIYEGRYLGDITHVFLEVPQNEKPVEYDWVPESLDVNGLYSNFRCSREFSHIQPQLLRHRRRASRDLRIVIRTSSTAFAGTDATVRMIIHGGKDSSDSMDVPGSFEIGDTDTTMSSINEIGIIRSIRIWHNNGGSNAGWKLDWVHIYELSEPDVKYEFTCNCWIEGNNNGKDLKHSTDCPSISNCVTQRCRSCTTCQSRSKDVFFRLSPDKGTCDRCPIIPNCQSQPCLTCDTCNPPTKNNVIFKLSEAKKTCARSCQDMGSTVEMSLQWLSPDKERCDLTCSYVSNRWCWPGSCSNGLMTSCSCESGFRKSGTSTCDITTKADLLTCNIGIEDHRSKIKNSTSIGNMTDCYSQTDVYINIQPEFMSFKITADFQKKVSSSQPVYIDGTHIGIVDSNVTVTRRDLSGTKHTLSSIKLMGGGHCNTALSSSTPSALVSCDRVLNGSSSLQNGEWLCGLIKVFSGGSFDYKNFRGDIIGNKRFTPLVESKTICFRYDNVAPVHCTKDSRFSCSSDSPLRLSTRTTKYPNITVGVSGWVDPYPVHGSPEQASGMEYIKVDVYGVKHLDLNTLDVDYANHVFASDELKGNNVNITVSLPAEPAMYVTYLEVHDVAGNVRFARRFLLYDNSSKLEVMTTRVLRVISASVDTRYTWQIHHGNIQLDWNERYHNDHYVKNDYFCHIKPDTSNAISGVYDQVTGILPVMGTVNIHGITSFKYQWCLNNGSNTSWESVPDFANQSLTLNLNLTDGETYEIWIEAQDIMLNTLVESVVVHIDMSVPDVADTWLVRDGTSQIYVHNNTDLSTMVLQFRAWDVHSGITSVLWALGTTNAASDLGNGALPVRKLDDQGYCPPGDDCYCPDVGPCEYQNYTLSPNSLDRNNGQHNTLYYFTLVLSNGALLKSFKHLDVLVDVTPAEIGIIQEGVMSRHDLDYTSDTNVIVSWKGFLDRESGIRNYIVSLTINRCLTAGQLLKQIPEYDALFMVVKSQWTSFNVTNRGKYFSSVLAINNALEPSDAVCSDGVFVDLQDTDVEKTNAVIICKLKM